MTCPFLDVKVSNSLLRVCRENVIKVKCRNIGSQFVSNALIYLELDDFIAIETCNYLYEEVSEGVYKISLGYLNTLAEREIVVNTKIDCSTELGGLTSCIEGEFQLRWRLFFRRRV